MRSILIAGMALTLPIFSSAQSYSNVGRALDFYQKARSALGNIELGINALGQGMLSFPESISADLENAVIELSKSIETPTFQGERPTIEQYSSGNLNDRKTSLNLLKKYIEFHREKVGILQAQRAAAYEVESKADALIEAYQKIARLNLQAAETIPDPTRNVQLAGIGSYLDIQERIVPQLQKIRDLAKRKKDKLNELKREAHHDLNNLEHNFQILEDAFNNEKRQQILEARLKQKRNHNNEIQAHNQRVLAEAEKQRRAQRLAQFSQEVFTAATPSPEISSGSQVKNATTRSSIAPTLPYPSEQDPEVKAVEQLLSMNAFDSEVVPNRADETKTETNSPMIYMQ